MRALAGLLAFSFVIATASLVFALSGAYRLARLSYLERRNRQLEADVAKVGALRQQLEQVEEQSRRLAVMLGIEQEPPPVNWDSFQPEPAVMPEWLKGAVWGSNPVPAVVPLRKYAVSQPAAPYHVAIDLAAAEGEPVRATADGTVADRSSDRSYGRYLLLQHSQGYESYYGHLQDWNVGKGDTVYAGQTIGWVGSTGKSSAPHLHFEIRRNGERLDPTTLLKFLQ